MEDSASKGAHEGTALAHILEITEELNQLKDIDTAQVITILKVSIVLSFKWLN